MSTTSWSRHISIEKTLLSGPFGLQKNHLTSVFGICDPDFLIIEWNRTLDQGGLILNLLRNSRVHPSLSAWAYINVNFDFIRTPLIPPGTKVVFTQN